MKYLIALIIVLLVIAFICNGYAILIHGKRREREYQAMMKRDHFNNHDTKGRAA